MEDHGLSILVSVPASSFQLFDQWLVGVAANENLSVLLDFIPFAVHGPVSNRRQLHLLIDPLHELFGWTLKYNLLRYFLLLLDPLLLVELLLFLFPLPYQLLVLL